MDTSKLVCPACGQPVHKDWSGEVVNASFMDFEKGGYQNMKEYRLACPINGKPVKGIRVSSGDRSGGTVDYKLTLIEAAVETAGK